MTKKRKAEQKAMMLLTEKKNIPAAEAYKAARTNLLFTLQKRTGNRVIITSAVPNEGKSTTCCNLGITLAQMNSRVLIIDCDLRKPALHNCYGLTCVPGLSEFLAEMEDELSEIVRSTEHANLFVICGGTVPPNPAELLGGIRMIQLLDTLSQEYDYILLDTPPVNLVADSLVLTSLSDGVVVVVRQRLTTHPELARALTSLKFAHAKVLGLILNGAGSGRLKEKKYNQYYQKRT